MGWGGGGGVMTLPHSGPEGGSNAPEEAHVTERWHVQRNVCSFHLGNTVVGGQPGN